MDSDQSMRLASICARGGSKGVLNKNLREVCGIPLIAHSIEQALKSDLFFGVAVSSDSPQILEVARRAGATCLVQRPVEMATDTAAKLPAIQHCFRSAEDFFKKEFKVLVDLDATSPLRMIDDIVGSVRLLDSAQTSNVITGSRARRSPYFNLVELDERGHVSLSKQYSRPIVRRQDAPVCFDMNASIYVWKREVLLNNSKVLLPETRIYEMAEDRSWDIDSELDFQFVQFLMEKRGK